MSGHDWFGFRPPGPAPDIYAGSGWLVLGLLLFMAAAVLLVMR